MEDDILLTLVFTSSLHADSVVRYGSVPVAAAPGHTLVRARHTLEAQSRRSSRGISHRHIDRVMVRTHTEDAGKLSLSFYQEEIGLF